MENKSVEIDGRKVYIDRSVGVTIMVMCADSDGELCVLCNRRGIGKKDGGGLWNIPSGYLDWDETAEQCAVREVYEECGIKIPIDKLTLTEVSTDPKNNKQNVLFRFFIFLEGEECSRLKLTSKNAEKGEVDEVAWLLWKDVARTDTYEFAWGQKDTMHRTLQRHLDMMRMRHKLSLEHERY